MDDLGPGPWNADVVCAACGTTLLPMSYPIPPDDDPRGALRAALKCAACGQRYRWFGPGWEPLATA